MTAKEFNEKFNEVRKTGQCTSTAKTRWGSDDYEKDGWKAQLQDEGYTSILTDIQNKKRYIYGYPSIMEENFPLGVLRLKEENIK